MNDIFGLVTELLHRAPSRFRLKGGRRRDHRQVADEQRLTDMSDTRDLTMEATASVKPPHRSGIQATARVDESHLISGLRSGSEGCYEELLWRIEKVVMPLVSGLKILRQDKDDLVQNVALKVFLYISRFRGESALNSWIYRIAMNEIYDRKRSLMRRRVREGLETIQSQYGGSLIEKLSDPGNSPFLGFAERQFMGHLFTAISMLPANSQEVLVLRAWDELSYEEIAGRLHVTVSVVKSRILTARRRLQSNAPLRRALAPSGTTRHAALSEPLPALRDHG